MSEEYRYLDMPDGNDYCESYDRLMEQVRRGRVAGIVSIKHSSGFQGVFMRSFEVTVNAENTFHACAKILDRAHEAAEANGHEVLQSWHSDPR